MAVFGIGAMYGSTKCKFEEFISMKIACVGWLPEEAPAAHALMRSFKMGDIVFIKSFVPTSGLHVKAVGIVTDPEPKENALGWGVKVRWRRVPENRISLGKMEDHSDFMRRGSIYEEYNPEVIKKILDVLLPEEV